MYIGVCIHLYLYLSILDVHKWFSIYLFIHPYLSLYVNLYLRYVSLSLSVHTHICMYIHATMSMFFFSWACLGLMCMLYVRMSHVYAAVDFYFCVSTYVYVCI